MGLKSIKVFQPAFSNWVIQRRQELNLSPAHLRENLNYSLSERTLKYLEGGKKQAFSEHTLTILAKGLELSYPDLLKQIEDLNSDSSLNKQLVKKLNLKKVNLFLLAAAFIILFIFTSGIFNNNGFIRGLFNRVNQVTGLQIGGFASNPHLQSVLIDADYPQIISAKDEKGNKVWQKNLDTPIKKAEVADLDQNGSKEVIAGTDKGSYSVWGKRPGWLLVWDEKGELLTEQNMWKPSIYEQEESHSSIQGFEITDLDGDGKLEIVTLVRGLEWYPSRLAILHYENFKFHEMATYWNPGFLKKLFIVDVDNDGYKEIICVGVNNNLKRLPEFPFKENMRGVFMLSSKSIFGQAPPYLGEALQGSQVWYYYITPPAKNDASNIRALSVTAENEKLIIVKLDGGCFFYLNYNGEIVDRSYGDNCKDEADMHLIPNDQKFSTIYNPSTP